MKLFKRKMGKRYNQSHLEAKSRVLAYYWQPKTKEPNIGDYLALDTVQQILHFKNRIVLDKTCKDSKLLSIGSVLHFASDGDTLWGTGRNGKIDDSKHTFNSLDVRSVRGPLTREYLLSKGISCPETYGDPAILSPLFYPEVIMCPDGPTQEFVIVPQLNDDMAFYAGYEDLLVSPRMYPGAFIKAILKGKTVISSSLHGIILAEAYGRNAIFLDSGSGETQFKYDDYYLGTGRSSYHTVTDIEEAKKSSSVVIPDLSARQSALIQAFPFDLWE
ncbi:polysaccharide pyruvyl transferase family protein [Paraglaciecola chathamensis]|uniref:polysaccharide pyruvyl transferase family protein n=1 Tax=Paraglaciecola chathamensis TaxID=368405 RepID=UPI00271162CE|nr:polysaccharide pyruvyl transferase family protein [Paraglaciecola chathamensis]MDO6559197.1 polysaccharide pyruvyl transferase family protein [Paraglaciecola chathamensis]